MLQNHVHNIPGTIKRFFDAKVQSQKSPGAQLSGLGDKYSLDFA
jgi:hypothetical protein